MKDEYFLLLDTSTEVCSVALGNRDEIVDYEETKGSNKHAEQLADIAARMLSEIDYKRDLKGVGVSNGPGSYTGLRIGASYAKGLCWTLGIPLVSVMTTELLAMTIFDMEDELDYPHALLMPMIDARRMEVYTAIYTGSYDDHYFGVVEPLTDIAAVVLTDEQSQARLQEIVMWLTGSHITSRSTRRRRVSIRSSLAPWVRAKGLQIPPNYHTTTLLLWISALSFECRGLPLWINMVDLYVDQISK